MVNARSPRGFDSKRTIIMRNARVIIEIVVYLSVEIFLQKNLAMGKIRKKEIIPEIKITRIIKTRIFSEKSPIKFSTAETAPVLVFETR